MHSSRLTRLALLCVPTLLLLTACVKNSSTLPETADEAPAITADAPDASAAPDAVGGDEAVLQAEGGENLEPEVAEPQISENEAPLTETEKTVLESDNRSGISFDLDLHDTKEVQQYFSYFTHKARRTFAMWLKRSEPFLPQVRKVFTQYGLPQDLVLLPFSESGYNCRAYSRAGAAGMWQFMPYTGRKFGLRVNWWIDERRDPFLATEAAAKYLSTLYDMFGDWYLALAAYNAGEGKISRALRKTNTNDFFDLTDNNHKLRGRSRLRLETRNYVPKFIAISKIFQNLESLGFDPIDWDNGYELETVQVSGGTDLLALAREGDMSWREFHDLNPAFRRQVSPPGMTAVVHIPREKVAPVLAYLANPGSRPFAGYKSYAVRSGDSWWRISRRFGVPINVLKQVNNTYSNTLRPGQSLMVPGRGASSAVADADVDRARTRKIARSRANYVVHRGDTLWGISRRTGVSVQTLARANGISRSHSLRIGQKLFIPDHAGAAVRQNAAEAKKVLQASLVDYRVRRGDNLWTIARRFGVSTKDLLHWNNLSSKALLHPGDKLKIYVP